MPRIQVNNTVRDMTAEEIAENQARETEWNNGAFNRVIKDLRQKRNKLLAETDFFALSDVTMSEDMTTYRQALRDLPAGLSTVEDVKNATYPTKVNDEI